MKIKIISFLLCVMFIFTAFMVSDQFGGSSEANVSLRLQDSFNNLQNWTVTDNYPLLDIIYDELKLDDYLHRQYTSENGQVTVYVGYYHSSKKVGAAHDPMVCFPGQGWKIEAPGKGIFDNFENDKYGAVKYSTMVAIKGDSPLLVLYWFQAYDEAVNNTFAQKLELAAKKIVGKGEENAFVRFSTPCPSQKLDECSGLLYDFIKEFYPLFYDYVVR